MIRIQINEDSTTLGRMPPPGLYSLNGVLLLCYKTKKGYTRFRNCETGELFPIWDAEKATVHIAEIVNV